MLSNLYRLDLHNGTSNKKWSENFPRFSYGYQKYMFVDFLTENIGPSDCIHYFVHLFKSYEDVVQYLLSMCFFLWCLLFNVHLTKHQSDMDQM